MPQSDPFKPELKQIVENVIDSLRAEISEDKLLSIQFFDPYKYTDYNLRIFISDWYASGSIDGYVKIDDATIAIYGLNDDYRELIDKNEITFFKDTLVGFEDVCVWKTSEVDIVLPQCFYLIQENDIAKIVSNAGFGAVHEPKLIRKNRCTDVITFTIPSNLDEKSDFETFENR